MDEYKGILNNDYIIIHIFDEFTYLAKREQTNTYHIIEFSENNNNNNNNFRINQINLLNILNNDNNPNILRYIENGNGQLALNHEQPKNGNYVVFEPVKKSNLFYYIDQRRFLEKHAKLIFKKILNGVRSIHEANYCHLNITPSNILFDERFNPKIFGFELCRLNANNLNGKVGNCNYQAPEILNEKPYNGIKCDIFSLGQLLFNLVCGILGFHSATNNDRYYRLIMIKNYEKYWNSNEFIGLDLSQNFKDLVVRMLAYDPNQRPTIGEILQSNWMQEVMTINNDQMQELEHEVNKELDNRYQKIKDLSYD